VLIVVSASGAVMTAAAYVGESVLTAAAAAPEN